MSSTMQTFSYGPEPAQQADLYLPATARPPVVCLLHGGYWRAPYGREQFAPVAQDLARRGFAAWNIGYRRLGETGGGWPGTMQDVADAADYLAQIAREGPELDLGKVVLAGHSAGGQLALWCAARGKAVDGARGPAHVTPIAAAGLAAIVDLEATEAIGAGNNAVRDFLRAAPVDSSARKGASPLEMLPLGTRQLILHGMEDDELPPEFSGNYAAAARAAGDDVLHVELRGAGHMDYLDPASEAHTVLCNWLESIVEDVAATGRSAP